MGFLIWIGIALVSVVPSLLIGAITVGRTGNPVTFANVLAYVKKKPMLIVLNFLVFGALLYALFMYDGA